ncbi:MAG: PspA/IM30 family protein [Planctomycetes bacterium]|nr:PspA/IM30 family protein [Planctomycetota bacterium]
MSILARIGRIARANIRWLLEKAEPPEQELAAKIEELTAAVAECKAAAGTYGATFRRLEAEAAQLRDRQAGLHEQAEAAIRAGDDAAGRGLLTEKVSATQRLAQLQPGLDQGRRTLDELRDNLGRLTDQLAAARTKQAELHARQRSAAARKAFSENAGAADTLGGDVFERMDDEVLQLEAEADVCEDMTRSMDLERRSLELQVEAELAAMKQRLTEGRP